MTSFYFPVGHPSDPECRKDLRNGTINQATNEVPSFPYGAESGHACGWMAGSNPTLELSNFYPEKKFTQPSPLKEVDLKFPVFIITIKGSQYIHAELKQSCPAARALYSPSFSPPCKCCSFSRLPLGLVISPRAMKTGCTSD